MLKLRIVGRKYAKSRNEESIRYCLWDERKDFKIIYIGNDRNELRITLDAMGIGRDWSRWKCTKAYYQPEEGDGPIMGCGRVYANADGAEENMS